MNATTIKQKEKQEKNMNALDNTLETATSWLSQHLMLKLRRSSSIS